MRCFQSSTHMIPSHHLNNNPWWRELYLSAMPSEPSSLWLISSLIFSLPKILPWVCLLPFLSPLHLSPHIHLPHLCLLPFLSHTFSSLLVPKKKKLGFVFYIQKMRCPSELRNTESVRCVSLQAFLRCVWIEHLLCERCCSRDWRWSCGKTE